MSHIIRQNVPQKERGQGPGAEFLNFKPSFRKFETDEARNFKFGVRIDLGYSLMSRVTNYPQKMRGQDPGANLKKN